jgi:hypothetical protein
MDLGKLVITVLLEQKDGTWDRLLTYVQTYSHAVSDLDLAIFVDSCPSLSARRRRAEVGH